MIKKAGVREFRSNVGKYIDSAEPIEVSRHGQTVGYFVPVHKKSEKADLGAFMIAARKVEALLSDCEIDEEELIQEFKQLRKNKATAIADTSMENRSVSLCHGQHLSFFSRETLSFTIGQIFFYRTHKISS